MVTPSQDLIRCKECGDHGRPHKTYKLLCDPCAKRRQVDYQRAYRERVKSRSRMIVCKGCGSEFDASKRGRTWRCEPCTASYMAEYVKKDRVRHAGYSRQYRVRLGDAYRRKMVARRREAIEAMTPEELAEFRQKEADKSRRVVAELRRQVFNAYGGPRCACCGVDEPLFLTIDHVNNDGAEMRREGVHGRGGTAFYQWLRKNKFPTGFQVLCMNCNMGKHRNGGVCPHHQVRCNDYPERE